MKREFLLFAIILQISFCGSIFATTSTGSNVEYIPASKNLGIGTVNPLAKLDVNGQILIRGGNPGAGKILQSDSAGKASWITQSTVSINNASTLDTFDSLQFLRSDITNKFSSGTLITDSATRFDINGDLSVADTDIVLDGANTSFTQSAGNINLVPASGKDLTTTIASAGEFKINTSDFVFNGTNARVGIGTTNPSTKLEVNGTIKGNVINGTSANFTNLTTSSITSTGTSSFDKLIVTNNVNGATANFPTANFTDLVVSGIINGSTTSFDGDFTNGSVLYSNNQGVISQDNARFYWDKDNKRLALNHKQPDMALDVNGAIAFRSINDGSISSPGSPVVFESSTAPFYSNGWSMSANKPAGTVDGDLLIAYHYSQRPTDSHNTPAGWTLLTFNRRKSVNPFVVVGVNLSVYYKIASGEPSSYTFTGTTDDLRRMVGIARYSGCNTANPIDVSTTSNGDSVFSSPNATVPLPSVTTTVANAKIVKIAALTGEDFFGLKLYDQYPSGYSLRTNMNYHSLYDKDQAGIGLSDNGGVTYAANTSSGYVTAALAIAPALGSTSPIIQDPDNGSMFLYVSNGGASDANAGDLVAKIKEAGITKTIRITDFNNGKLATAVNAETIDGITFDSFLRADSSDNYSSGTLTFDSSTSLAMDASSSLDINSTNVSIADTDITLDGANTSFTQSTGNISLVPASGKDLTTTIASGGEFKINTSDFVFNGTNARVGIGTTNPSAKLDVNGTIKGLVINGTNANFTVTANVGKLISLGVVNGTIANFVNGNISSAVAIPKLIASGTVNGTSGNFTIANVSNLNLATATINTLNTSVINNSGTISTAKLISSGVINGTTANLGTALVSGTVNGTNANFTNVRASNFTGNFDGDFTNGSVLFSNNQGVISQANSHLYWDRVNNNLAIGTHSSPGKLTVNGVLSVQETVIPSTDSGFGKLYVDSGNSKLYFQDDSGSSYNLTNGSIAITSPPSGNDTEFQFNNGNYLSANGALTFTKANKTLHIATDAPLDINSTAVSIADNDIAFDSASGVTFTPTPGQSLNIALSGAGDFAVNTNQLYLDTSAAKLGLMLSNPNEVLTINGALSLKEGTASTATSNFGKFYVKASDSKLYFQNDSGVETNLIDPVASLSIDNLSDGRTTSNSLYMGDNFAGLASTGNYNTAIGLGPLSINNGNYNTAFGYQALLSNNGDNNTAFGANSLHLNNDGENNVAIYSLWSNANGSMNTAVGGLVNNTIGNANTGLGFHNLAINVNGDANIAIGYESGYANVSGNGNIAIGGEDSLRSNVDGHYNTVVGSKSLVTSGSANESYNTILGSYALSNLKHGYNNIALGTNAISVLYNGSANLAIGFNAGRGANSPSNLYVSNGVHIGYNSGYADSGDNNIFIGYNGGTSTITGSNNILIGYNNTSLPSNSASNQLDIADTIYGDLANHNIGIDTASIDAKLEVNGTAMINLFVSKAIYSNSSANNVTINWNNASEQKITLGHNVTFAFTAPSAGIGTLSLMLTQDGTGSRTVTWPASVKWPGGTPPTLSSSPGYVDLVNCVYESSSYLCQIGLDFR